MPSNQMSFHADIAPNNWEKPLLYTLWGIAFLAPLSRWLWHTGNPYEYVLYNAPIGQVPYLLSKLMALFALALLVMQFLLIALRKTNVLSSWSIRHHAWVGAGILICAVAHVGLFIAAKGIRGNHLDLSTILPNFGHGYYRSMLSIGSLALMALLVTVIIGVFRKKLPGKRWFSWLHKVSFVSAVLIIFHCLAVGSEI